MLRLWQAKSTAGLASARYYENNEHESKPFLAEIITRVGPKLILLTGTSLQSFLNHFAKRAMIIVQAKTDSSIKQIVFEAAVAGLKCLSRESLVVRVAHASQFGWTYDRYRVPKRILHLLAQQTTGGFQTLVG